MAKILKGLRKRNDKGAKKTEFAQGNTKPKGQNEISYNCGFPESYAANYGAPTDGLKIFQLDTKGAHPGIFEKLGVPAKPFHDLNWGIFTPYEAKTIEKVYDYKPINGIPEIKGRKVYIQGMEVGSIRIQDRLELSRLIKEGAKYSIEIKGGPYKITDGDYTYMSRTGKIKATLYAGK